MPSIHYVQQQPRNGGRLRCAGGVAARCAAALPGDPPARLTVSDLPPAARTPGT